MNPILTADFTLPVDGMYQIAPEGEFLHRKTGLRQIIDDEACRALVNDFTTRAAAPDFAGVLVDYDHESLDVTKRTEAAGWLMSLEHRPGAGLWGRIRWTDEGEKAVAGGRYRFLSPVWKSDECTDLGECRIRPMRLTCVAVTNTPNMPGAEPLANAIRATAETAALLANRILANALQPGNAAQRRAVFAKLRGAPLHAAPGETPTEQTPAGPAATPKTAEELAAADAAGAIALEQEQAARLALAKTIARRKAIEADKAKAKPYTSAQAEAIRRGIQQAKAQGKQAAAAGQQKQAQRAAAGGRAKKRDGLATPKTVASLPVAYVRPTTSRLSGGRGLQWMRGGATTQASRNVAALRQGASIVDFMSQYFGNRAPMSDEQRRAMYARIHAAGASRTWTPKTKPTLGGFLKGVFQLGTGTYAKFHDLNDEQRKGLARLESAMNATGALVPAGLATKTIGGTITAAAKGAKIPTAFAADATQAEAYLRGLDVGKKSAAGFDWSTVPAKIKDAVAQGYRDGVDSRATDTLDEIMTTARDTYRTALREHGPNSVDTHAAREELKFLESQWLRTKNYANRGGAMTDEQRRAMFARMSSRGRAASDNPPPRSGESATAPAAAGPVALPDHTPTRATEARIAALVAQKADLTARLTEPPDPAPTLDPIDTRALRAELMRQGKDAGQILKAVAAAEEHNRAAAATLAEIAAKAKARGVAPDKIAGEVQKEIDRRAAADTKMRADWTKDQQKTRDAIAAIDAKIAEEDLRDQEARTAAGQKAYNDAIRAQIDADKARAAAQLRAEASAAREQKAAADKAARDEAKKTAEADPIRQNAATQRRNRAYGEALIRGDMTLAERLAPGVDHAKAAKAIADQLPEPEAPASPRNSKKIAEILGALERTAPRDVHKL